MMFYIFSSRLFQIQSSSISFTIGLKFHIKQRVALVNNKNLSLYEESLEIMSII